MGSVCVLVCSKLRRPLTHTDLKNNKVVIFASGISGFTNMSADDYRNVYWSQLKDALDQMLTHPPGSYKPISYEQVRLSDLTRPDLT